MTTCISASRKLDRARKFRLVQARGICGAIRVRLVEAPFHLLRGARNLPLPLTVERTLLEQRQEKPLHDDTAMQPFAPAPGLARGARNLPLPLTVERTLLEQRQEKPLHDDNAMQPFCAARSRR